MVVVSMPRGRYFGEYAAQLATPRLTVIETRYAAGTRLPRHRHETPYLCVVLAGGFDERALGSDHECVRGTPIYNAVGEAHSDYVQGRGTRCLNIELGDAWISEMQADAGWPREPVVYLTSARAPDTVGRLECELRYNDAAAGVAIEGLVLQLLAEVSRHQARRAIGSDPIWLRSAVEFIRARFTESLSLGEIATAAGVHPAHLSRTFTGRQGCTIGEYVRKLRADWAYREILAGAQPLARIAVRAGFSDQSHLTRVIRSHYGVSPARLRNLGRPRNSHSSAQA